MYVARYILLTVRDRTVIPLIYPNLPRNQINFIGFCHELQPIEIQKVFENRHGLLSSNLYERCFFFDTHWPMSLKRPGMKNVSISNKTLS